MTDAWQSIKRIYCPFNDNRGLFLSPLFLKFLDVISAATNNNKISHWADDWKCITNITNIFKNLPKASGKNIMMLYISKIHVNETPYGISDWWSIDGALFSS